MSDRVLMFS